MKREIRDNAKLIKDLFSERWDRAEAIFRNQAHKNNRPRTKELQAIVGVVPFTVDGKGFARDDTHTRSVRYTR